MRSLAKVCAWLAVCALLSPAVAVSQGRGRGQELAELNAKIRRFAPTVVTADASRLSPGDRRALAKIIEAARLFDPLFLRQVWGGNPALKRRLEADRTPLGRARLHYFNINDGPWSQLDENVAFLASSFRSVRFGIKAAHGRGVALQFNYLTDEGAVHYDERTGAFRVVPARVREAVRKLAGEILTIQAEGSYERARALLERYAVVRPPMQRALDSLKGVPVDIEPSYPLATRR